MLSYDLAHPSPLPPLSRLKVVSLSQSCCALPVELTDGEGLGEEPNHAKSYDGEKAWSSIHRIQYSLWKRYKGGKADRGGKKGGRGEEYEGVDSSLYPMSDGRISE